MSTNELKAKLYKLVDDTNTSRKGIDYLVNYYIHSLGWSEDEAIKYAIKLFEDGVIDEIKVINGKEAD
ncbi:MAG TPA: hypothetical protein GXX66_01970 [Acholeplasmataceae bacterium]|jgi:hypothetical protein|nr:hypothetical protein [Acholeplasmataceae bacterium]